jgi:hypothetical protein
MQAMAVLGSFICILTKTITFSRPVVDVHFFFRTLLGSSYFTLYVLKMVAIFLRFQGENFIAPYLIQMVRLY